MTITVYLNTNVDVGNQFHEISVDRNSPGPSPVPTYQFVTSLTGLRLKRTKLGN